jgi:hypothetical protein
LELVEPGEPTWDSMALSPGLTNVTITLFSDSGLQVGNSISLANGCG